MFDQVLNDIWARFDGLGGQVECAVEFRVLGVNLSTVFDQGLHHIGVGFHGHGGQMERGVFEPTPSGLVYLSIIQYRLYDKRFVALLGSPLKRGAPPSAS